MSENETIEKEELNKKLTLYGIEDQREYGFYMEISIEIEIHESLFGGVKIHAEKYADRFEYKENTILDFSYDALNTMDISYEENRLYPGCEIVSHNAKLDASFTSAEDFAPYCWEEKFVQSDKYYEKWKNNKMPVEEAKEIILDILDFVEHVVEYKAFNLDIIGFVSEFLNEEEMKITVKVEDLEKKD